MRALSLMRKLAMLLRSWNNIGAMLKWSMDLTKSGLGHAIFRTMCWQDAMDWNLSPKASTTALMAESQVSALSGCVLSWSRTMLWSFFNALIMSATVSKTEGADSIFFCVVGEHVSSSCSSALQEGIPLRQASSP